ncbi:MAG: FixH family protein [Thiobacillus sp.]|nr:FixH family protein [Thiobacillus sp.]
MNSAAPGKHNLPWWKERMVWLIIALPLSAVVAGLTTVYIAARDPDDLVKADYVKTGMAVVAPREALASAARLGISARLAHEEGTLLLNVENLPADGEALQLTLVHPTKVELDQIIPLQVVGQGKYQAQVALTGQGKRHLILEPAGNRWRLEGDWQAPFTEETSLHAGAHNPSTHP